MTGAATQRTKYQHYVPRLMLKHFEGAAPRGMVWVYDKKTNRRHPTKITETGGQRNFYSVDTGGGEYNDVVDESLQTIEGAAAGPFDALVAGTLPVGEDLSAVAMLVATQYLRTPGMLRSNAEAAGKMMQAVMNVAWGTREQFENSLNRMERETGEPAADRDRLWEFWNKREGYTVNVHQQRGLIALTAARGIHDILVRRHWHILDAAEKFFITSDQPVVLWEPPKPPFMPGAFANPAAEITLPLSPSKCLLITGHDMGRQPLAISGDDVDMINGLRAYYAERNLWAHVASDEVRELAVKHAEHGLGIQVDNGGPMAEVRAVRHL